MKRYELKVKFGRNVILHKIFEFNNHDQVDYIKYILERCDMHELSSEVEDVVIKTLGMRYWAKNYPKDSNSLYSIPLTEFAEKHPDILVAAYIQYLCYEPFGADLSFNGSNVWYTKEEIFIDKLENCEWTCKILKD